jgi:hypothetical protein
MKVFSCITIQVKKINVFALTLSLRNVTTVSKTSFLAQHGQHAQSGFSALLNINT